MTPQKTYKSIYLVFKNNHLIIDYRFIYNYIITLSTSLFISKKAMIFANLQIKKRPVDG